MWFLGYPDIHRQRVTDSDDYKWSGQYSLIDKYDIIDLECEHRKPMAAVTGLLRHDSTTGMTNIVTNKSYSCQEKYLRIVGHFNIMTIF